MIREIFSTKRIILFFILLNIGLLTLFLLSRNQDFKDSRNTVPVKNPPGNTAGSSKGASLEQLIGKRGRNIYIEKMENVRIPVLEFVSETGMHAKISEFKGESIQQEKDGCYFVKNPSILFYTKPTLHGLGQEKAKKADFAEGSLPLEKKAASEGPPSTRITAVEGLLFPEKENELTVLEKIIFQKDVKIEGLDPQHPFLFTVKRVECYPKKRFILSDDELFLRSKGLLIRGTGLEASEQLKRIKIRKNVLLRIEGWAGFLPPEKRKSDRKVKSTGILSVRCKDFLLLEDFEGVSMEGDTPSIQSCKATFYNDVKAVFVDGSEKNEKAATTLLTEELYLEIKGDEGQIPDIAFCKALGNIQLLSSDLQAEGESFTFRRIAQDAEALSLQGKPSFSLKDSREDRTLMEGSCFEEIQILKGETAAGKGISERILLKKNAKFLFPKEEASLEGDNITVLLVDSKAPFLKGDREISMGKNKLVKGASGGGGFVLKGSFGTMEGDSFTYDYHYNSNGEPILEEIFIRGDPHVSLSMDDGKEARLDSLVPGTGEKKENEEGIPEKILCIRSKEKAFFRIDRTGQKSSEAEFTENARLFYEEGGAEQLSLHGDVLRFYFQEPLPFFNLSAEEKGLHLREIRGEGNIEIKNPQALLWGDLFHYLEEKKQAFLRGTPARLMSLDSAGEPSFEVSGTTLLFNHLEGTFSVKESVEGKLFGPLLSSFFSFREAEEGEQTTKSEWAFSCGRLHGTLSEVKEKEGMPDFSIHDLWAEEAVKMHSTDGGTIIAETLYLNAGDERGFLKKGADPVYLAQKSALGSELEDSLTTDELFFSRREDQVHCPKGGRIVFFTEGGKNPLGLSSEEKKNQKVKVQIVGKESISFNNQRLVFKDAEVLCTSLEPDEQEKPVRLLSDLFTLLTETLEEKNDPQEKKKKIRFSGAEAEGNVRLLGGEVEGFGHLLVWNRDEKKLTLLGKGEKKAVFYHLPTSSSHRGEVIDHFYGSDADVQFRVKKADGMLKNLERKPPAGEKKVEEKRAAAPKGKEK